MIGGNKRRREELDSLVLRFLYDYKRTITPFPSLSLISINVTPLYSLSDERRGWMVCLSNRGTGKVIFFDFLFNHFQNHFLQTIQLARWSKKKGSGIVKRFFSAFMITFIFASLDYDLNSVAISRMNIYNLSFYFVFYGMYQQIHIDIFYILFRFRKFFC